MKLNSIKKNAILNILYTTINFLFPVLTFPYVSRVLSTENMGKVAFFSSLGNYAVIVASLGISIYGIRAVAKVRDNKQLLSKITAELLMFNTIASIVVSIILFLSMIYVDKFKADWYLLFINIILVLTSGFSLNWFYSGLEQYAFITKRTIQIKILSLCLVFFLVKEKSDYNIYATILVFSVIITNLINLFYARNFISLNNLPKLDFKIHFSSMMILFSSILAVNVYTNLDSVILGFIRGDEDVGLYTVAIKAKSLVLLIINSISAVLLPRLSYYLNEGNSDKFNMILRKSIHVVLMISLPCSVFFMLEAEKSILLLGGEQYIDAVLCMQIVMPILIISSFSNITGNQILIPLGKEIQFMKAIIFGACVNISLNLILIPKLGIIGAAISTLLAEVSQLIIQVHYSRGFLKDNFNFYAFLKINFSAFLSLLLTLALSDYFSYGLLDIVFLGGIYFSAYFMCLLCFRDKVIIGLIRHFLK